MGRTEIRSQQIKDADVKREDLDVTTVGKAVIAKLIAGTGVNLTSTGADAGTGDVTISSTIPRTVTKVVGSSEADYITDGTDDHVQIQAAVTAVLAAGGGTIELKDPVYQCGNSSTSNIVLNPTTSQHIKIRGTHPAGCEIRGGTVEYSNNSTSVGVITTPAQSGAGANTSKTLWGNVTLENIKVKSYNGGYGISIFNVTSVKLKGSIEAYTAGGTGLIKAGIWLIYCDDVEFDYLYAHDTNGNGVNINGCDNVRGLSIRTKNTYDDGCDIDCDFGFTSLVKSRNVQIAFIHVDGTTQGNGIRVENAEDVNIGMFIVENCNPNGVWVGCYEGANNQTCKRITFNNGIAKNNVSIGYRTEIAGGTGNTVEDIVFNNCIGKDNGANSGTDIRGNFVHGADVTTGKLVMFNNCLSDGVARTGGDAGGFVIYKKGNVEIRGGATINAENGVLVWNGSGSETYSNVYIDNVTNTATNKYPNQNNAITQSGVIIRKKPTQSETFEVSKVDAATTVQGYFRGFNPSYPNAWAGMEVRTAEGGDQTDLLFYTGYGSASEKMRIRRNTGNVGIGVTAPDAKLQVAGQYVSQRYDAGDSGTSKTVDFANGNVQKLRLTGNCTLTLSNPVAGGRYLIELLQDATGSRTVTFPSTVKWAGGTAPTLTTTAGRTDIITLFYNGTNYAASASLNHSL